MCRGSLRRTARHVQRQCRASPGCAAGTTAVSPSTSLRRPRDWAVCSLGLTSPCSWCCGERSGQGMCWWLALECMENIIARVCILLCLCSNVIGVVISGERKTVPVHAGALSSVGFWKS